MKSGTRELAPNEWRWWLTNDDGTLIEEGTAFSPNGARQLAEQARKRRTPP